MVPRYLSPPLHILPQKQLHWERQISGLYTTPSKQDDIFSQRNDANFTILQHTKIIKIYNTCSYTQASPALFIEMSFVFEQITLVCFFYVMDVVFLSCQIFEKVKALLCLSSGGGGSLHFNQCACACQSTTSIGPQLISPISWLVCHPNLFRAKMFFTEAI